MSPHERRSFTPSNTETARNGRRSLAAGIVSPPMRRRVARIGGKGRNLAYRVRLVTGSGAKIK